MKFKFNKKKLVDEAMKKAYNSKIDFKCPNCGLFCGQYSLDEVKQMGEIFCYNCDLPIKINFKDN